MSMNNRIVIQAGHINTQFNSIPALQSETGTDGEQELTLRIANALSALLRAKGFDVVQTDANANSDPKITTQDYDFFLALHGDANVYGTGGGFITAPDPAFDAANEQSIAIAKQIQQHYFAPYTQDTGIVEHLERNNPNATQYYMWMALTAKTPCALIEMGVVKDAHDSVILADTNRVCNAIAKGICAAFNIPFDVPTSSPTPPTNPTPSTPPSASTDPCATQNAQIILLKQVNAEFQQTIKTQQTIIIQLQAKPTLSKKVALDYILQFFGKN